MEPHCKIWPITLIQEFQRATVYLWQTQFGIRSYSSWLTDRRSISKEQRRELILDLHMIHHAIYTCSSHIPPFGKSGLFEEIENEASIIRGTKRFAHNKRANQQASRWTEWVERSTVCENLYFNHTGLANPINMSYRIPWTILGVFVRNFFASKLIKQSEK